MSKFRFMIRFLYTHVKAKPHLEQCDMTVCYVGVSIGVQIRQKVPENR